MRASQILPRPPRMYPIFNVNYMRPSHNLPLPPRKYPPFQQLYATLLESTHSPRIYPHFQQLQDYATLPESAPPS